VIRVLSEGQTCFRMGRGTTRLLAEKFYEQYGMLYNNFISFKKAFYSFGWEGFRLVPRTSAIFEFVNQLLEGLYKKCLSSVCVDRELVKWFQVTVGVNCRVQPVTYLIQSSLEVVIQEALNGTEGGVKIKRAVVSNLSHGYVNLIAETQHELQELTKYMPLAGDRLPISKLKTKILTIGKSTWWFGI
jgi:hypothetical protein